MRNIFPVLVSSFLFVQIAYGQEQNVQPWWQFVASVRAEAISEGIRAEVFEEAFRNVRAPNLHIIHLDKTQPERRLTFLEYRNSRVDKFRIQLGRKEYNRHKSILNEIGDNYGVSPCFIASLWGMETSYGHYMGHFPVIQSLATLAYNSRRSEYFRKQLLIALHILDEGHVSLENFKGEWAGASGHPQFMPSTWKDYAVDYSGDGRKDIWLNLSDAFASIANYLAKNGWQKGQPWAILVTVPSGFDTSVMDMKVTKTVSEWARLGVKPVDGDLSNLDLPASLMHPDGGPTFMIFNNFKVLMKWNRSNYYVGTVGYLAEEICQEKL